MKKISVLLFSISISFSTYSQSVNTIKKILDTTSNPIGYVKFVLKKKYFIDTVAVVSTSNFIGKADSLAYKGKLGKVYGPFKGENILIKILYKSSNTFYHVNHIVLDTSLYTQEFATGLADRIIENIKLSKTTFAAQAITHSADYSTSAKGGDLAWFVRGIMLPQLDEAISKHKKGEIFTVWTPAGLHIVKITDNPKKDTGYALMLRVIL